MLRVIPKSIMRKIIFLLTLLVSFSCFSQSNRKIEADLIKRNRIKKTTVYTQDIDNNIKKRIWYWSLYDKEGRVIELKRFWVDEQKNEHYRFEYPNNKTQIILTFDNSGKIKFRSEREYNFSLVKEPRLFVSKNGQYRYVYDNKNNTREVWNLKKRPQTLLTKLFFDENNLIKKQKRNLPNGKIFTLKYKRDKYGNLSKITARVNGVIDYIETYKHEKYDL